MRVELFGIARARAGAPAFEIAADRVDRALRAVALACPQLVPEVIVDDRLTPAFVACLNGERFVTASEERVGNDDVLLILDAHAGG